MCFVRFCIVVVSGMCMVVGVFDLVYSLIWGGKFGLVEVVVKRVGLGELVGREEFVSGNENENVGCGGVCLIVGICMWWMCVGFFWE